MTDDLKAHFAALETKIKALKAENSRLQKLAASNNADAEMYAKAWQRELGDWMWNKRHHIDACVIGTRKLVEAERKQRAWLDGLKRWRNETDLARTLGLPDPDLMTYLPAEKEPA